jgi:membrane associated rhomboid family serine protease
MPVTLILIAINVVVFAFQNLDSTLTESLLFAKYPGYSTLTRAITSGFAHSTSDILHIVFNMWSLYVVGRILEPALGKLKFILLYFLSLFGGAIGVLLLAPEMASVVGASGAIFGLMASLIIVYRMMKADARQIIILVAINFVISFTPGIAWEAHLGGFIVGGLITLVYARFRRANEQMTAYILVGVIAIALAGLWIYGTALLPY